MSYSDVAAKITSQTGVAAKYVPIPAEALRKAMLEQGMPEWQVTALIDLGEYYVGGQGGDVDGLLARLLGRAPVTMDQFLKECAGEFRGRASAKG